ncbi:MAG: hypothetical protein IPI43_03760 [Sandaracinaceae bacterium]|nr:hypothetical protein [Sandaracinaceae bacterium]
MTARFLLDTNIVSSPISKHPPPPAPGWESRPFVAAPCLDQLRGPNVKDFTRFKGVEVENWSKLRG